MKKNNKILNLIIFSIIFFAIFPLNILFTSFDIGYYGIIIFISYIIFWVIPIFFFYNKKIKLFYYILLLALNIIIFLTLGYLSGQYGINNKETRERIEYIEKIENDIKEL